MIAFRDGLLKSEMDRARMEQCAEHFVTNQEVHYATLVRQWETRSSELQAAYEAASAIADSATRAVTCTHEEAKGFEHELAQQRLESSSLRADSQKSERLLSELRLIRDRELAVSQDSYSKLQNLLEIKNSECDARNLEMSRLKAENEDAIQQLTTKKKHSDDLNAHVLQLKIQLRKSETECEEILATRTSEEAKASGFDPFYTRSREVHTDFRAQ